MGSFSPWTFLLWLSITLQAQEVPNTGTVDQYRDQLNRLGVTVTPGQYAGEHDAAERSRQALRAPLLANPNMSAAEVQAAQTSLLRLTDLLAADEARAAQTPGAVELLRELSLSGRRDAALAALRAEAKRLVQQPAVNPAATPAVRGQNLALGKPTRQSSFRLLASRGGVDGDKSGSFGFYTESQLSPWWDVDLQHTPKITEIRVYNSGINTERARTLQVLLSEDGLNWQRVYTHDGSVFGAGGQPLLIPLKGVPARWVRVQLAEKNYLHLDEIEVYAAPN